MTHYGDHANPRVTPQTEAARSDQVQNNAGGFVFSVGPWKQLDRFLVLGQVGPTYYATERAVVKNNVAALEECLREDGPRVVRRIVEISDGGRAPKNDPAIFALSVAASSKDPATVKAALEALPKVCRIGTHLFHFAADINARRGWGRALRRAIGAWYTERSVGSLAKQLIKYQQRDGWSHRDLLRLAHPKPQSAGQQAAFRWATAGIDGLGKDTKHGGPVPQEYLPLYIDAFLAAQRATDVATIVTLIREYDIPREAIPTQFLNDARVWEALLPGMGLTAMIRNLGKMTSVGLLRPLSDATARVAKAVADPAALAAQRVHPMQLLIALGVYGRGRGDKGSLSWSPTREVVDALDAGFYAAFKNVEPTGKRTMIALDVSGSMDTGVVAGAGGITPRIAAMAMAMVTARTEPRWLMAGFTSGGYGYGYGGRWGGSPSGLTLFDIGKNERLDEACRKVARMPMGGTDCALPMVYATKEKLEVDVFQVYTDNETWAGQIQPFQALREYRQKTGIPAKLAVVGLTATDFTIADPNDAGMLDVVGMDAHAPAIMADFAREGI